MGSIPALGTTITNKLPASMSRDKLKKLLKELDIISEEKVTLRSGEESNFYCNIKKAFGYPNVLNALASEVKKIIPASATCIAASGYGGIPLASVISSNCNIKLTMVRPNPKDHGKKDLIDGYIPNKNDVVIIVDDVLTSGSSIKETLKALRDNNVNVHSVIVIVKRGDPEIPIPYNHIFEIKDFNNKVDKN